MAGTTYWHGGAPGLRPGDVIEPRADGDTRHLVDGCPTCEARRVCLECRPGKPEPEPEPVVDLMAATHDRIAREDDLR